MVVVMQRSAAGLSLSVLLLLIAGRGVCEENHQRFGVQDDYVQSFSASGFLAGSASRTDNNDLLIASSATLGVRYVRNSAWYLESQLPLAATLVVHPRRGRAWSLSLGNAGFGAGLLSSRGDGRLRVGVTYTAPTVVRLVQTPFWDWSSDEPALHSAEVHASYSRISDPVVLSVAVSYAIGFRIPGAAPVEIHPLQLRAVLTIVEALNELVGYSISLGASAQAAAFVAGQTLGVGTRLGIDLSVSFMYRTGPWNLSLGAAQPLSGEPSGRTGFIGSEYTWQR